MKQYNFSISFYWDARIVAADKTSRIFITINLKSGQFRICLKQRSTHADFLKALSPSTRKISSSVLNLKLELDNYRGKALTILTKNEGIDKDLFVRLFKSETNLLAASRTDVYFFFEFKISECLAENRIGTFKYYHGCMANLKAYKTKLYFEDIDAKWLKQYYSYLRNRTNSSATIALRMRALKIIYNLAVSKKFIKLDESLFRGVSTGSTTKSKEALYPIQLKTLWNYQPDGIRESRAIATFFFLYLANGMNLKDMAYLKWSDLKNDSFSFIREKTKNTKGDAQEIVVHFNDVLKRIITEYGTNKEKDDYVFSILKGKSLLDKENSRSRYKRICNKSLSKIGKKLGFEVHLCLNIARHSFATMHKILGTPVAFISESLGHGDISTTSHYLKNLPDENRKEMSDKLLSFRNE